MTLTDEQGSVVTSLGNAFVRACPGAGKTRTLVELAARSAAAAPRYGVAFLSFTNAAGDEVRQRLAGAAPALLRPPSYVTTGPPEQP
jgi:superfamily I DNA/RNA helicase